MSEDFSIKSFSSNQINDVKNNLKEKLEEYTKKHKDDEIKKDDTSSENELVEYQEEDETKTSKTSSSTALKSNSSSNVDSSGNPELDALYMEQQIKTNELIRIQKSIASKTKELNRLSLRLARVKNGSDSSKSNLTSKISTCRNAISELESNLSSVQSELSSINQKINQILSAPSTSDSAIAGASGVSSSSASGSFVSTGSISSDVAQKLDKKLGSGFAAKCEQVAAKLGCDPNDLLGMMYSESGLNPNVVSYNGAVGLIQFMPSTLKSNGYSQSQVANMTGVQQLDVVYDILAKSKSMAGFSSSDKLDGGSLYAICFLPAYAKNEILCSQSGSTSWAYGPNSGLDIDKDGNISKTDLAQRLKNKYQEMAQNI